MPANSVETIDSMYKVVIVEDKSAWLSVIGRPEHDDEVAALEVELMHVHSQTTRQGAYRRGHRHFLFLDRNPD